MAYNLQSMVLIDEQILIYALLGILILVLLWIIRLEFKFSRLLRGKNAKSLEDTIAQLGREVSGLHLSQKQIEEYLIKAEQRIRRSVQGMSTVRFNPFKGTGGGGNQSFATALLNENGDGVVLSSLYSRERVSVYAKPVKKFSSEYELTGEEKQAIKSARNFNE